MPWHGDPTYWERLLAGGRILPSRLHQADEVGRMEPGSYLDPLLATPSADSRTYTDPSPGGLVHLAPGDVVGLPTNGPASGGGAGGSVTLSMHAVDPASVRTAMASPEMRQAITRQLSDSGHAYLIDPSEPSVTTFGGGGSGTSSPLGSVVYGSLLPMTVGSGGGGGSYESTGGAGGSGTAIGGMTTVAYEPDDEALELDRRVEREIMRREADRREAYLRAALGMPPLANEDAIRRQLGLPAPDAPEPDYERPRRAIDLEL